MGRIQSFEDVHGDADAFDAFLDERGLEDTPAARDAWRAHCEDEYEAYIGRIAG